MAGSFTYDVFLSNNSQHKQQVRKLAERLKEAVLRVWFDDWIIKPGDDIYLAIERGLAAARVQVLCLSPAALGSEWVMLERSTVLFRDPTNVGRRFVPLLLADCTLPDTTPGKIKNLCRLTNVSTIAFLVTLIMEQGS